MVACHVPLESWPLLRQFWARTAKQAPENSLTLPTCLLFSLTLSLVEKEQRLLVLQEADSVRQQELSSLCQDMQEAQEGQKELSAQVPPNLGISPFPWRRLLGSKGWG